MLLRRGRGGRNDERDCDCREKNLDLSCPVQRRTTRVFTRVASLARVFPYSRAREPSTDSRPPAARSVVTFKVLGSSFLHPDRNRKIGRDRRVCNKSPLDSEEATQSQLSTSFWYAGVGDHSTSRVPPLCNRVPAGEKNGGGVSLEDLQAETIFGFIEFR